MDGTAHADGRTLELDSSLGDPGRGDLTREMNWAPGQKSAAPDLCFPRLP